MVDFIDKGILVESVKSITTSASTYVLTASETSILRFTGTVAQTVKLPNATSCLNGHYFYILNRSTEAISLILNSNASLTSLGVGAAVTVRLFDNTTSDGTWDKASSQGTGISLQEAYDAGNVITTSSGTHVVIEGTESLKITTTGGLEINDVPIISDGNLIIKTTGSHAFVVQPSYLSGTKNPGPYSIDMQLLVDDDLTKTASGYASTTIGGARNTAAGDYSIAIGGLDNAVYGDYSAQVGATNSIVSGDYSAVVAGTDNICNGDYSFVGGGFGNHLNGNRSAIINASSSSISYGVLDSAIVAGRDHTITSGECSVIIGGTNNTIAGDRAVVLGGQYNKANYSASVVGGMGAYDLAPGDFVLGNDFFAASTPIDGKGNFFRVAVESGDVHIGRSEDQNPVYELNNVIIIRDDYHKAAVEYSGYPNLNIPNYSAVYLTTTGTLPGGLTPNQTYYFVAYTNGGGGSLFSDRWAATAVTITASTGSGTHKLHILTPSNKLHLHTSNYNNESKSVSLQAPTNLTSSVNLVLPGNIGSAGQVLTTDGSGNLSWQSNKNILVYNNTEISGTATGVLFTYTIPANTIKNGDVIEISGYGTSLPSSGIFAVFAQIEGRKLTDALTDSTPWTFPVKKYVYDEAGSNLKSLSGGPYLSVSFDTTQENIFRIYMDIDSGVPSYEVILQTTALLHFKN